MLEVNDLHAEYLHEQTTFVGVAAPRLSWHTSATTRDWTQSATEVRLTRPDGDSQVAQLPGPASVLIAWPFTALQPRERVQVEVRVSGPDGEVSPWSHPLTIESAALAASDWSAQMIAHAAGDDLTPVRFVRDFTVRPGLARARLRATAHGVYEARLNSTAVSDEVLAPGWTAYQDRLLVQTHDVTAHLTAGPNRLAATVAAGWYGESFGYLGHAARAYRGPLALLAQVELEYHDGSSEIVATGPDWLTTRSGPITASGIYHGEHHDARRDTVGWADAGTALPDQSPAVAIDFAHRVLTPAISEPVRRTTTLTPFRSLVTPSGRRVLDFGQNIAGRVRLTTSGPAGQVITLRHAEVLEDGELALRPLRLAQATDSYTLAGGGPEQWEPTFTFHGFRYLQVDGWPSDADPVDDIVAVVCHSDMHPTGTWSSSHAELNRLHENVRWSMRGNFLAVPTDCPQRDERLGWTGDLQVFAPTASFLYDVRGFTASWLADLSVEQVRNDGVTPLVVPSVLPTVPDPVAGWGDATTVVPWVMYEYFGDVDLLRRQYDGMRTWAEVELARTNPQLLWLHGGQIGDHLDPTAPPDRPTEAKTAPEIVASAYLIRSLQLVAASARVLDLADDAQHYADLAERSRAAFEHHFVTPGGRMVSDAPTAYALAIAFDLVRDIPKRQELGDRLAELVQENGYRVGTGFMGTPVLLDALLATGQTHAAGRLLLQTRVPSWLYAVTMGATTIWERWDSLLPDGGVNPGEMTSFNHYALGSVAGTLHRRIAGIGPAAPGYSMIRIAPQPVPGIDAVSAAVHTPYGPAAVAWRIDGRKLHLTADIPANTTAEVLLPGATEAVTVGSGTHEFTAAAPTPAQCQTEPVDLDSDLATLVDIPEALDCVVQALARHDPQQSRSFLDETRWKRGSRLADALMFVDPVAVADVRDSLAALSRPRVRPGADRPEPVVSAGG